MAGVFVASCDSGNGAAVDALIGAEPTRPGASDAAARADATSPDADAIDVGPADSGVTDLGERSCPFGARVDVDRLKQESRDRLRSFFGTAGGFEPGRIYFRDGASGVADCPAYDQSALIYVTPMDPALPPPELRAPSRAVAYLWFLNGYRYVYFTTQGSTRAADLAWGEDRHPLSGCSIFRADAAEADRLAFVRSTTASFSHLPVDYLDQIGILCWGPRVDDPDALDLDGSEGMLYTDALGIAERVRRSSLFESSGVEWSAINYGFPTLFAEAEELLATDAIEPECLRTVTASLARAGRAFASEPSLGAPFGLGWIDNADACAP